MEEEGEKISSKSFVSAMTLKQLGVPCVPQRYVLPPLERPMTTNLQYSTNLPIIDLSSLQYPSGRSQIIQEIKASCSGFGFFQFVNHGIPLQVISDALEAAAEFFDLPIEEKMQLASDSVHEPVRYGTSLNHARDKVHCWRDFIKHYAHPISDWIHLWPSNPPSYKKKIGEYSEAVQKLQKQLWELVMESLDVNPNYLQNEVEAGSQVMAVNFYPECPNPELTLGIPPHSDYGTMTILLQSDPGLQIKYGNENWVPVPVVEGALIVQLGDQMEVISNGIYKSVLHRATVNSVKKRISIASLHSLPQKIKVGPISKLADNQHGRSYKEFSFQDFLEFLSKNDINQTRFINTLKNNP